MNTIIEKLRALIKMQIHREELNFASLGGGGQTMNIGALEWVLKQLDTLQDQPVDWQKVAEAHAKDQPLGQDNDGNLVYLQEHPACEGLEEYAQKVEDYYDVGEERGYLCTHRGDIKNAVIAGAKWKREQMLKEAVEGDIGMILHDKTADLFVRSKGYLPKSLGIKCDDKVRIIIVKED